MKNILFIFLLIIIASSCNENGLSRVSKNDFIGSWLYKSNNILNGIEVEVSLNEKNELTGIVTKLNDNKYVNQFLEVGDIHISDITRKSNFEFIVKQKKLAAPLFELYNQSTTESYDAEFDENGDILLGQNGNKGRFIRQD